MRLRSFDAMALRQAQGEENTLVLSLSKDDVNALYFAAISKWFSLLTSVRSALVSCASL
jgi:hypothetical protein